MRRREADDLHVDKARSLAGVHDRTLRDFGSSLRTDDPQRAGGRERLLQLLEPRELNRFRHAVEDGIALLHDATDRQMCDRIFQLREKLLIVDANRRRAPVWLDADLLQTRRRVLDLV